MKILMLTWEYPPRIVGGIARVVHDLSKRLIKDGHEVTVVTYKDGDLPEYENDKGVKVYRVENYMIRPNNFIDWIMQLNFNMVAKASEIIRKEGNLKIENSVLNLSTIFENYKGIGENYLDLNIFIENYKKYENSKFEENEKEIIMKTKSSNKNKYTENKILYINKENKLPTKLIIQDNNQNTTINIQYNSIELN